MTTWRGAPLTHEAAEALFIGWRESGPQLPQDAGPSDLRPYSWLIAAGANAAYDVLPSQHQLYSYGRGRGQMWYEPVFAAVTLDGRRVWRRRRYRVRRGALPGTFYYSVLDNGVTSNEVRQLSTKTGERHHTWCHTLVLACRCKCRTAILQLLTAMVLL